MQGFLKRNTNYVIQNKGVMIPHLLSVITIILILNLEYINLLPIEMLSISGILILLITSFKAYKQIKRDSIKLGDKFMLLFFYPVLIGISPLLLFFIFAVFIWI